MNQPISIRPTAVAGSFYPKNLQQLDDMLNEYLRVESTESTTPKAIIAPHAGYIYSGPIAGSVYSRLKPLATKVKRVILLGPAHRVYVKGIALPTDTHFASPLGNVPLDTPVLNELEQLPGIEFLDIAHTQEHSLEVHLPFLQKVLQDFTLVPLLVGDAKPEHVAAVLEELWGGEETLIVVSSDLSHYLDYETANQIDADTTRLIEHLDFEKIGPEQACGCMPMRGLLKLAQQKNLSVQTLDLRNSGDTAGTKDRVVGYGAYIFFNEQILNHENKEIVFDVIRKSIEYGLHEGQAFQPVTKDYAKFLQRDYAVFITLKLDGQLRGCIGTTEATMPLINAAAHYAYAAAFNDPRFKPLTEEEYQQVEISLSILTPASPMDFKDEQDLIGQLRPGIDGLIISRNNNRATFLPVVWESLSDPIQFLSELKKKAGIKSDDTPEKAWRYQAEYYS